MIIYVAGKYRDTSAKLVNANIMIARKVSIEVWKKGHVALCPHLNTMNFEVDGEIEDVKILDGDKRIVERCDGLLMLPNWTDSDGAKLEKAHAESLGMPIWYYPDIPVPHLTEIRCPIQSRAFVQTVMRMYRLHLQKNADYSPNNVLGPGFVGLVTRLWDKITRLMELTGFRFSISEAGEYVGPKEAANEPIEDSLIDAANYGVIGLLLRQNMWGK